MILAGSIDTQLCLVFGSKFVQCPKGQIWGEDGGKLLNACLGAALCRFLKTISMSEQYVKHACICICLCVYAYVYVYIYIYIL